MAGVAKRYNGHDAIAGLDLEVPAGSVVGVVGPSGSGKTTTIRMITGSLAPTAGTVEVLGERPGKLSRRTRERIGYLPQIFSMYPDLSVLENVDFAATLYGLLLWQRYRRRRAVLELVDLWDVRGRRAGQLSGGMKRRLELAAALVHEPDLLVLDEPTAGIDPLLRRTIWDEIHRLREAGVTSVVTTQYVTEAEECNLVALISDGRLIGYGTPDDIRRAAFGGEVVDVTTTNVFDGSQLTGGHGIVAIRQTGPRDLRVVVEDAGTASADIVQAIGAAGAEVDAVREIRPSFEEVFGVLIERDRAATAQQSADGDGGGPGDDAGTTAGADERPATTEAA